MTPDKKSQLDYFIFNFTKAKINRIEF